MIRWEEPGHGRCRDFWYQVIPCKYGHIYQHGNGMLGFACNHHPRLLNQIRHLDFVTFAQVGDDGANIVFPEDKLGRLAKYIKPKRRRIQSQKQLESAARNLRPNQSKNP